MEDKIALRLTRLDQGDHVRVQETLVDLSVDFFVGADEDAGASAGACSWG